MTNYMNKIKVNTKHKMTLPRMMFLLLAGGVGVRGEIRGSDSVPPLSTLSL